MLREVIDLELAIADLSSVEKRLDRAAKLARSGDPQRRLEQALLQRLAEALAAAGPPAAWFPPTPSARPFAASISWSWPSCRRQTARRSSNTWV